LGVHNIYLKSSSLGSFDAITLKGETDVIKKIPVSAGFGYSIIDSTDLPNDFISVSKSLWSMLDFKLTDTYGNIIPLHGSHISFSITMKIMDLDA
jgi:hypothetical protein